MSIGINKVTLLGNLGQDPEARYMPSGSPVTNISIATNESWRDKETGEQQQLTEWHRVVFFNRLAEIVCEYMHKGSLVYIEGTLRTRKWQDAEGRDCYTVEIVASELRMLDKLPESDGVAQRPAAKQGSKKTSKSTRFGLKAAKAAVSDAAD